MLLADWLLTRPPRLLRPLLPGTEWTAPAQAAGGGRPILYLTFDDGPIPEQTPWVLEQLAAHGARATFFCVGQNVARYPSIARQALAAGHRLGNHTQHHRSAWTTSQADYLADVAACRRELAPLLAENALRFLRPVGGRRAPALPPAAPPLFRPPYGRLSWPLLAALRPRYRVVMWSVLTRDYDADLAPEACLRLALAATRPGDILVFHDSYKAARNLRFVLPRLLAHFAAAGYAFEAL